MFSNSRVGNIAGSYVREGTVQRNARARVIAPNRCWRKTWRVGWFTQAWRDDVREVRAGFECGISLEAPLRFQEGDIIEFYVIRRGSRASA